MRDLLQIKYEILDAGSTDVLGEWTIEDLGLFHSTGRFSRVWLMWETIKRFCLLTDEAHAKEREKLRQAMKEFDGKEPATEEELEDLFMFSDLHAQTEHSSSAQAVSDCIAEDDLVQSYERRVQLGSPLHAEWRS
jgi:hypothetical protein